MFSALSCRTHAHVAASKRQIVVRTRRERASVADTAWVWRGMLSAPHGRLLAYHVGI